MTDDPTFCQNCGEQSSGDSAACERCWKRHDNDPSLLRFHAACSSDPESAKYLRIAADEIERLNLVIENAIQLATDDERVVRYLGLRRRKLSQPIEPTMRVVKADSR